MADDPVQSYLDALDAGLLEAKSLGVRHATDGDQHDVRLQRFRGTAGGGLDLHLQGRAA